jgi:hypothetical protein
LGATEALEQQGLGAKGALSTIPRSGAKHATERFVRVRVEINTPS